MSTFHPIATKAAQILRESTPEELAALFAKHSVTPQPDGFIGYDSGAFDATPCEACLIGVATLEAVAQTRVFNNRWTRDQSCSYLHFMFRDLQAFSLGFDGGKWFPPSKLQDEAFAESFAKGKRVWELATQTKENT